MRVLRFPMGGTELKRLAALVSLLGVFFLPLHFHSLTAPAKLAKECACVQGTRTVASLAPAPSPLNPVFEFQPIALAAGEKCERISVSTTCIRAPPAPAVS
jgi:hypothetical protein